MAARNGKGATDCRNRADVAKLKVEPAARVCWRGSRKRSPLAHGGGQAPAPGSLTLCGIGAQLLLVSPARREYRKGRHERRAARPFQNCTVSIISSTDMKAADPQTIRRRKLERKPDVARTNILLDDLAYTCDISNTGTKNRRRCACSGRASKEIHVIDTARGCQTQDIRRTWMILPIIAKDDT